MKKTNPYLTPGSMSRVKLTSVVNQLEGVGQRSLYGVSNRNRNRDFEKTSNRNRNCNRDFEIKSNRHR